MATKKATADYTVVCSNGPSSYVAHVEAASVQEAMKLAREAARKRIKTDGIAVVFVAHGWVHDARQLQS